MNDKNEELDLEPSDDLYCPQCGSLDVDLCYAAGSAAIPETHYLECSACGCQWDHS